MRRRAATLLIKPEPGLQKNFGLSQNSPSGASSETLSGHIIYTVGTRRTNNHHQRCKDVGDTEHFYTSFGASASCVRNIKSKQQMKSAGEKFLSCLVRTGAA